MREILFRGKNIHSGEWAIGNYAFRYGSHYIYFPKKPNPYGFDYEYVIPETVGQYTGLTDKKGTKIFEGDIVKFKWDKWCEFYRYIEFSNGEFLATPVLHSEDEWSIRICGENEKLVVIGNIHDNPELMEGGAE